MDKETKKYLEAMEDRLDSRFQKMQSENNKWFLKIYHQGTGIEARIDALEERVTALEKGY